MSDRSSEEPSGAPSQHPLRPDLPDLPTTAPDPFLAYQESHAAHPPEFNPYASVVSNPYLAAAPVARPVASEPYAHWGMRVCATLLDNLLTLPFILVALIVLQSSAQSQNQLVGALVALACYLGAVVFSFWNQIIRQGRRGASLGKHLLDLRVVSESDGRPIGAAMTFVRSFLHLLDSFCAVGYLWPLWDAKRQTFADKLMKTAVLHLPPQ